MQINKRSVDLIHSFEGCRLTAYKCPAGVWTIGWGNTVYEDGSPVKQGDTVTQARANKLFESILNTFRTRVIQLLGNTRLNANQFGALVSFAYNVGTANLERSTLLRKVRSNPADPTIRDEFMKWTLAAGKSLPGLVRRRTAEANLYFNSNLN